MKTRGAGEFNLLSHRRPAAEEGPCPRVARAAAFRVAWLCLALQLTMAGLSAFAQTTAERQVQAAFLTKFAGFVEWPSNSLPAMNSPFVIGVVGDDPFGPDLDTIASQQRAKGRVIRVERFKSVENVQGCQILFVASSEQARLAELFKRVGNLPLLTVGDSEGFTQAGGIINFTKVEGKVRFEVNHEAARRAGLALDARLLAVSQSKK